MHPNIPHFRSAPTSLTEAHPATPGGWRPRASLAAALLAAGLVSACGGGGGGGGGSASNGGSGSGDGGSSSAGTTQTSAWPFPIGMSLASPTALAAANGVIGGALGVNDLGLQVSATPQQGVVSSQADAVATGRLGLAATGLADVAALFDTSARAHAACYGPAVTYSGHDDASGASGTLPAGELAIWRATADGQTGGTPCAAAEIDTQLQPLARQSHQAVLLLAALRRMAATDASVAQPSAGGSTDITAKAASLLAGVLSGVSVQSAQVALNSDASETTWRLVLTRGSGSTAQTLELSLLHTPADTDTHYAGTLRLALSYLSANAALGCADQIDSGSGLYKAARLVSLGYNRQDEWLSLRLRAGQYCGNGSGTQQFEQLAATAMSGELDPAVFLTGSTRGSTLGWRQGFIRLASDTTMSAQTTDFAFAWQDQPLGGTSRARLFAGHSALDTAARTRGLALYHGYTDDISHTDGTLRGMVCNWAGPGSTQTLHDSYQYQSMSLAAGASGWALGTSQIAYAPTNSCAASTGMRFDADGDGSLGATEGQGVTPLLAVPAGSNEPADVMMQQGYLSPVLIM